MHSLQDLRMTSFLWQWCIRKRKEKNARLGWILCLHTDIYLYEILKIFKKQDKNKQTKKKTLGKRKHTSTAMNVDGGWGRSSQPVTFWLSDDVMCTACCRRVRATAWPAFCKHHPWEQATPTHPHLHTTHPPPPLHTKLALLYTPSGTPTPPPPCSINMDTTGLFLPPLLLLLQCISERTAGGPSMLDPYSWSGGGGGKTRWWWWWEGGGARTSTVQPNNCIVGDFW